MTKEQEKKLEELRVEIDLLTQASDRMKLYKIPFDRDRMLHVITTIEQHRDELVWLIQQQ